LVGVGIFCEPPHSYGPKRFFDLDAPGSQGRICPSAISTLELGCFVILH
jgi:hypothetical protein